MQDVRTRSLEDEIIFQKYGIVGYATFDGGVCDSATCSDGEHQRTDDNQGQRGDTQRHRED